MSVVWGYVAPMLNAMQNHRTHARWDDGLTLLLVWVKIFVTLWNFAYLAFVKSWTSPRCSDTWESVADLIWGSDEFDDIRSNATLLDEVLRELKNPLFSYEIDTPDGHHKVCVRGCFPSTPEECNPRAETNCQVQLRQELIMFFFVHVVYTLAFLVFPMIKVKIDMLTELKRARTFGGRL